MLQQRSLFTRLAYASKSWSEPKRKSEIYRLIRIDTYVLMLCHRVRNLNMESTISSHVRRQFDRSSRRRLHSTGVITSIGNFCGDLCTLFRSLTNISAVATVQVEIRRVAEMCTNSHKKVDGMRIPEPSSYRKYIRTSPSTN